MSSSSISTGSKAKSLDVDGYLTTLASSSPAQLNPYFESLRGLYKRKLWHQLTLKLFEFFSQDLSKPYRVDVFQNFVQDFESRLNQLRLVELGVMVSKGIENPSAHVEFLSSLLSRINKEKSPDAYVRLLSSIAQAKLLFGDLEGTKNDMDAALRLLDDMDGVEPSVNGSYYNVAADYYRAKMDYAAYYKNCLLYLACVDIAVDLTPDEHLQRARELGIASLLGETIYNFGELLTHPIMTALDGTPHDWIKKLLVVFNEGNIGKFEALTPIFTQESILQEGYPFLRQKICLMALIEFVFKRTADNRTITFHTIAQETRLSIDEVEHLVMKALSLKLIRGSLDQVDQTATITWVQPRVLSSEQIGALSQRLASWCEKLNTVEQRITPELPATA